MRTRACTHTHSHTHTHTYTDCSRNWVLILIRMEILREEEVFSLALKDDRVEQCLRSKCGVQSKRKCGSHESCVCIVGFPACRCQKKSVVYKMECRHAAVQRGKHIPKQWLVVITLHLKFCLVFPHFNYSQGLHCLLHSAYHFFKLEISPIFSNFNNS